jgi:hypothetical protein
MQKNRSHFSQTEDTPPMTDQCSMNSGPRAATAISQILAVITYPLTQIPTARLQNVNARQFASVEEHVLEILRFRRTKTNQAGQMGLSPLNRPTLTVGTTTPLVAGTLQ